MSTSSHCMLVYRYTFQTNLVLLFHQAPISDHLRPIALSAITRFVEWVEFNVLLMQECKLLLLLYTFISLEELKTAACECLLVILARKVASSVCMSLLSFSHVLVVTCQLTPTLHPVTSMSCFIISPLLFNKFNVV